jgi:hypothetical protein
MIGGEHRQVIRGQVNGYWRGRVDAVMSGAAQDGAAGSQVGGIDGNGTLRVRSLDPTRLPALAWLEAVPGPPAPGGVYLITSFVSR